MRKKHFLIIAVIIMAAVVSLSAQLSFAVEHELISFDMQEERFLAEPIWDMNKHEYDFYISRNNVGILRNNGGSDANVTLAFVPMEGLAVAAFFTVGSDTSVGSLEVHLPMGQFCEVEVNLVCLPGYALDNDVEMGVISVSTNIGGVEFEQSAFTEQETTSVPSATTQSPISEPTPPPQTETPTPTATLESEPTSLPNTPTETPTTEPEATEEPMSTVVPEATETPTPTLEPEATADSAEAPEPQDGESEEFEPVETGDGVEEDTEVTE